MRTAIPALPNTWAQPRSWPPLASSTASPTPLSRSQAISSCSPAGVLGFDSHSCSERMHASAVRLETSMPTILPCCGILPLPSLLVRALAPTQLFGLKEDTGPVPRSPSGFASGCHGLRSSDGRLLAATAPLAHLAISSGHKGGPCPQGLGG